MLAEIFFLKLENRIRIEVPQQRPCRRDPRFVPVTLPRS